MYRIVLHVPVGAAGYLDADVIVFMEGENDLGSHRFGKCFIDINNNTITTKWDNGWDNWTGRAYDVDGEIKLYDTTTIKWRTTFKTFEEGKKTLRVKN